MISLGGKFVRLGSRMHNLCNVVHLLSTLERQTPFFSRKCALVWSLLTDRFIRHLSWDTRATQLRVSAR
jgi:hypothetical protein